MRHRKAGRKLGRTAGHRKALLANIATALFEHKHIMTTEPKAKEVRRTVDRIITFAKSGSLSDRRQVLRTIRNKRVVKNIFEEIAPTFQDRNGGYTRVIKLGSRPGDGADMAMIELVGYEGVLAEKQRSRQEEKEKKDKRKEEKKEKEKEE